MNINRLSIKEIIAKIGNGEKFEATPTSGGFIIKISKYVPFFCTAIHSGSALRSDLEGKTALNDYERWYEEDPNTDEFIASMPITIVGLDSRFEYDLNRKPDECIYEEAWGKKVWNRKLTESEKKISRQKHRNYYSVLEALIAKIESLFGGCILYDIHSFNYKRWDRSVPLFNVGTELVNKEKFGGFINNWLEELSRISLPDINNTTLENDVFYGRGYNLEFVSKRFENTVVLATEIKKVYCDELTSDLYPKIIRKLQQGLKDAILNHANFFSNTLEKWHHATTTKLLDKRLDSDLLRIDKALYSLLRNFELLATVNPTNTKIEKRKFFKYRYTKIPSFKYSPVKINPYILKQDLLSLPINMIKDVTIRQLYESVVIAYTDKIDMIASLNSKKFLYNSLRYFGRPSKKDLLNANYILHLPDVPGEPKREPTFNAHEAMDLFKEALDDYQINAKVELSNKVISQVLVLNSKRSILFQPDSKFKKKELNALIEHEIGIHMATTMNSAQQKLKVFNVGLPVNTQTQEGLAVLSEYLSGNITLRRLKKIALRVIIVDMMSSGADFIECFNALIREYQIDDDEAFILTTRIFRGGGFTKDYLYLSGFVKIFKLWREGYDLTPLLVGKSSLPFLHTIEEMIGREMIEKPKFIAKSYLEPKPENNNAIYSYILSGLKL